MNEDKALQIENGNFTRIVNPLIEKLIQIPFKGCELAIVMFIIRKTYGFHKLEDEISITQFEKGLKRGRPTIVKALKNLQLVKILILVKRGTSKNSSNTWRINKYYKNWELVKTPELVKGKGGQLVKTPLHTKEITKEIIHTNKMKKNTMGKYREDMPSDSFEQTVDLETGEIATEKPKTNLNKAYKSMTDWASKRRGSNFVNLIKQYKALASMREAKITQEEIMNRWAEMEADNFWSKQGFDFTNVANSFDKKR